MEMELPEISTELRRVENEYDNLNKLFGYKTLDEDPNTRGNRPLFIEVGGPETYVRIYPENRSEHDRIKNVIMRVILNRIFLLNKTLDELCMERIKNIKK
jgi:hypothetical protein